MRPSLRHPLTAPRGTRRARGRRKHPSERAPERELPERATERKPPERAPREPAAVERELAAAECGPIASRAQPSAPGTAEGAARRARDAGGPTDQASYSCECGYLFTAAVTTTVECPHCGAGQAW